MPKKRATPGSRRRSQPVDSLEQAASAVEQAQLVLEQAEARYASLQQASDESSEGVEPTITDVLDGTLALVRRYPGLGILASGLLGFLLGRGSRH